jgi:chromosome segregation protein
VAAIQRRRAAPDEGPGAGRRAQLQAELTSLRAELGRAERERAQRSAQIDRLEEATQRDAGLGPAIAAVVAELEAMAEAIASRRAEFEAALSADREAGEHVAVELRTCAQEEATLQGRLHTASETLTSVEVRAQRAEDQAQDTRIVLDQLASELGLEAAPAEQALDQARRSDLQTRLERLVRRREQLGPVNPLAEDEYAEAMAHVEDLERQRADLESALHELEKLIRDTDRQIRETFEETFTAAARNFEELVTQLFPGGRGRLRLVSEREGQAPVLGGLKDVTAAGDGEDAGPDGAAEAEEPEAESQEDLVGVEIEITPAGKATRQLTLLSGGEKSMTALAFLFAVFLARPCPFYVLDEVEAALDDLNIDRFLDLLDTYSSKAQFIVVTHQKRTMEAADALYGVSMGGDGISKVISRRLPARQAA